MAGHLRDIFAWMITTLMADTTLVTTHGLKAVFTTEGPEGADHPYCLLQKQTGGHGFLLGNNHVERDDWVMVKFVDFGDDGGDRVRQMSDRAAELLEGQTPTIPGGVVYLIRRQNDVDYVTSEPSNQHYWQVGSVYSVKYN